MMKRLIIQLGLLSLSFSLATAFFGWWAVPVLAGFWGLYERATNWPALVASAAAGLGWGLLLLWTATRGPVLELSSRVSGVLGVPSVTFFALTLMFPAVLAWGASVLGGTVRYFWLRQRTRG